MNGVKLSMDSQNKYLDLTLEPTDVPPTLEAKALLAYVKDSTFKNLFFFEEGVKNAADRLVQARTSGSSASIVERIAERRDAELKFEISEDSMFAMLSITAPYGGTIPSLPVLTAKAKQAGVLKGLGIKKLRICLEEANRAAPGAAIKRLIAKGLPPKTGKASKLKPLVANALDRILRPQETSEKRVDMRNLGDIICVKVGTPLLRRLPPGKGRSGVTVRGNIIPPVSGEWRPLRPGDGTVVSDSDENLLVAEIAGMPKFRDEKMWVDATFSCNGVNVGSGNVNYDGAVLVNGDVTEKMVITATGDVTINGFVDSATIQSGGDIIITEGAMGKVNEQATEYSTVLIAQGSIHIQHGQGLDITCNGNVTVGRQLAYSKIHCGGSVTVGPIDNPTGNLFSCEIQSQQAVRAGTLGAVSGSSLTIDFSTGFNTLLERKDTLDDLLACLQENNARHKDKVMLLQSKKIPRDLQKKFDEAMDLLNDEIQLMQWLQKKADLMKDNKEAYLANLKLIANKRLYPGVVVKLNNRTWRAEKEYGRAEIKYSGHQWEYEPIVG